MIIIERLFNTPWMFQATLYIYILSLFAYLISLLAYIKYGKRVETKNEPFDDGIAGLRKRLSTIASILFALAFLFNVALVANRWIEAGRPPFKTLYETLIYATFTISFVYVVLERFVKIKALGILVSLLILGIFVYSLTVIDVEIVPLMPALQTPIMIPHVTSYFFAYAGVFVAGLTALLSLLIPSGIRGFWLISDDEKINFSAHIYKIVKFAFLFLTFGLVLGSWWGQVAWSNYWGWDPKENWALISWFVITGYFHVRFVKGWNEKKLALLVVVASLTILFTYLGMKYLPKDVQSASLHVYIEE